MDDSHLTRARVLYESSQEQTTTRNEGQAITAGPRHESKKLTERHIGIVAIAGMMGTGLFLTSGKSLAEAGPGGALLGYILMGLVTISGRPSDFLDFQSAGIKGASVQLVVQSVLAPGAATGWNWAYALAIVQAVEIVASTLLVQYWTHAIPKALLITVFWAAMVLVNLMPLRVFGEMEFAFGSMKISLVIFLVILGIIIDLRAGPQGERLGLRYWKRDAFKQFAYSDTVVHGVKGCMLAVTSTLLNAAFVGFSKSSCLQSAYIVLTWVQKAFAHIQIIAIAGGETQHSRRAIPNALRRTSIGVFALYVSVIFTVGLILPSTHPGLQSGTGTALSSPFVIAAKEAGIVSLDSSSLRLPPKSSVASFINAIVLTSAFSAGITSIFASSQALVALANEQNAPAILGRTNAQGVPYVAVLAASSLGALAYLSLQDSTVTAFWWLVSLSAAAGLVSWCVLCFGYLRLMEGMRVQGFSRRDLPYRAPMQPYLVWFALSGCLFTLIFGGSTVFLPGNFRIGDFLTNYANILIFWALYFTFKLGKKTEIVKPLDIKLKIHFDAVQQERSLERQSEEYVLLPNGD
ncbi:hypothetical protein FRB97_008305 [Tulasnella sp. 331]|nr:hypothetical protein FRB97_008305 [Tulasnella sp. 331]